LKIFERIRNASDKEKTSSVLVRLEQKKNWVPEYLAASIRPHHWVVATARCVIDHEWPTATGEWLDATNMSLTKNLLSASFKVSQHVINFDVVRILDSFLLIPFQDFTMV